jgi:hypothetical protein
MRCEGGGRCEGGWPCYENRGGECPPPPEINVCHVLNQLADRRLSLSLFLSLSLSFSLPLSLGDDLRSLPFGINESALSLTAAAIQSASRATFHSIFHTPFVCIQIVTSHQSASSIADGTCLHLCKLWQRAISISLKSRAGKSLLRLAPIFTSFGQNMGQIKVPFCCHWPSFPSSSSLALKMAKAFYRAAQMCFPRQGELKVG